MKDDLETEEYVNNADGETAEPDAEPKTKPRKPKFSGAYYYVHTDDAKLAEFAFIRTILTILAFVMQMVTLVLPEQKYVAILTEKLSSLALFYVVFVFVFIIIGIWLFVMNAVKYKFMKRIPVERAPKSGFKRRAFFGTELYIAANAALCVFQIVFISIAYDPITLAALFLSALAVAAAVAARQVTHIALKNSEYVPALLL